MTSPPTAIDTLLNILGPRPDAEPLQLAHHDWESLPQLARSHRVGALVWHNLVENRIATQVPAKAAADLNAQYLSGWHAAQSWKEQLNQALVALHERKVPVILLKGVYLASSAYPSPALRPMGDVDLLIPADRMRDARDALIAEGYSLRNPHEWVEWEDSRMHRHPPPLVCEGCLSVELHDTIEPSSPPFSMPVQQLWSRAQPAPGTSGSALALSPEDLLLHLATHMGRSHLLGSSLVRITDISFWCQQWGSSADWDAIVARCNEFGMGRYVYAALELARRVAGAAVPPEAMQVSHSPHDDAAMEHAVALLNEERAVVSGSLSLTRPDRSAPIRLAAALRALILSPHDGSPQAGRRTTDSSPDTREEDSREDYATYGTTLTRLLSSRNLFRTASRVRELRQWSDGGS